MTGYKSTTETALAHGGTNALTNLQLLCHDCHAHATARFFDQPLRTPVQRAAQNGRDV